MITLIIAITIATALAGTLIQTDALNMFWSITFGIVTFLVLQIGAGLFFRKKVTMVTEEIQNVIMKAQEKISRKANVFQNKPAGGPKHMQKLLEKDQHASLREAIEMIDKLKPFYPWSLLLNKQADTMRMQFYYQLGEFKKVDELLPNCIYMEPMTVAMKMARQYKNDDPGLDKTFKSKIKKFKNDNGVILYALYSWILVKRKEKDKAFEVLTTAKEKTSNEVISRNWEMIANDKMKSFSNNGLGDEWFSLRLENPKAPKQKMKKRFK
jgi:hypothetical protein